MGPAARRSLTALVGAACCACTPVGPREVTGGHAAAQGERDALALLAEPGAARIVAAERSGQGSRLVLIDEHGATIRALTDEPVDGSIDMTPAWSPDGRWVLFASSRGRGPGELSLWIVPVFSEGGARRLTDPPTVDMTPAWGADGRIAWASTRGGAGFDIWIAELSDKDGTPKLANLRRVTKDPDEDTMPAPWWKLLVWVRHHEGAPSLVRWSEEDGEEHAGGEGTWPAFARAGQRMAFVARDAQGGADVSVVLSSRGASPLRIDSSLGDESAPRFSVDGRFLFATSVVRTEGGEALWSSIVFADLSEDRPKLRALYDKDPRPRLGVDLAPVPLDADALLAAPEYRAGLKQVLSALGLQPE